MGIELRTSGGVAEVIIDFPPVNALPVQGWFDLADAATAAGEDAAVRAVVIAAEGRGFCAGVDIKEIQRAPGHQALLGASRGCSAAFAAVYDCPVPVIAAARGDQQRGRGVGQPDRRRRGGRPGSGRHRPGTPRPPALPSAALPRLHWLEHVLF